MPQSPLAVNTDLVSIAILINGKEMDSTYSILSIAVDRHVNKIATASFVLLEDTQNETFNISESKDFIPGNKVEIKVGYNAKTNSIFKGIITGHGLSFTPNNGPVVEISCTDIALLLTSGQQNRLFKNATDSSIISQVLDKYGALSKKIETTKFIHPLLNQYQVTDWIFLLNRAKANGMVVNTQDGKVVIEKLRTNGSADLVLTYGQDVIDFEGAFDAKNQITAMNSSSWDDQQQKIIEADSTEPTASYPGNFNSKTLTKNIGFQATKFHTDAPVKKENLTQWTNAQLAHSRATFFRGKVRFIGNHLPRLNTLIELKGFGKRYNGMALITGIQHEIAEGRWTTTVKFGLEEALSQEILDTSLSLAHGLLPSVAGLHIGIVKKIHEDPDGDFRVLVELPGFDESDQEIWARFSNGYATKKSGIFFYPEVEDEVIIGFLNNDARFPIILGNLYSKVKTPPFVPNEKNQFKAIVSKTDIRLVFDDVDKILTITTPGGQEIQLSDKAKTILIKDENGNKLEMTSSGIALDSAKDISLSAKGSISLKANQKIDINSSGDVNTRGLNVTNKAKMAFEASGSASAKVNSSGQLVIQGAMVMIN